MKISNSIYYTGTYFSNNTTSVLTNGINIYSGFIFSNTSLITKLKSLSIVSK